VADNTPAESAVRRYVDRPAESARPVRM